MNEHIPTKLIRGNKNKKPWISKEVKSLIRKRNKQYKKYKKTKDKIDLKRYKETKTHLQKAERQSYWKYINNIIEIGDPDQEDRPPKQKRFWSYIKSKVSQDSCWYLVRPTCFLRVQFLEKFLNSFYADSYFRHR
jgi:hypothetical protein